MFPIPKTYDTNLARTTNFQKRDKNMNPYANQKSLTEKQQAENLNNKKNENNFYFKKGKKNTGPLAQS